mgnify:CR=1 FL=1
MRRRTGEAAVEEAAVSAGEGVGKIDFGQTKDNEDDQRSYQNQCDDVFQNGNEAGTLMVERKNRVIAINATSV